MWVIGIHHRYRFAMRYVNQVSSIALRVGCITMALALAMGVIVTYLPPGANNKYHLAYWRVPYLLVRTQKRIHWFTEGSITVNIEAIRAVASYSRPSPGSFLPDVAFGRCCVGSPLW